MLLQELESMRMTELAPSASEQVLNAEGLILAPEADAPATSSSSSSTRPLTWLDVEGSYNWPEGWCLGRNVSHRVWV